MMHERLYLLYAMYYLWVQLCNLDFQQEVRLIVQLDGCLWCVRAGGLIGFSLLVDSLFLSSNLTEAQMLG